MREQLAGVTFDLADAIRTHIDAVLTQMNVCLPAKIVAYDPKTQYASVQIQLKQKYEDGTLVQRPVVPNVPVIFPRARAGKVRMHWGLYEGDDVTLNFSQRSLDNWKTQGGMQDPADRRKFHISDCYATPGGSAKPDAFPVNDPDSIEIINENGIVQIKKDGTINLGDYAPSKSVALGEAVEARLSAIESKLSALPAQIGLIIVGHTHIITAPGNPSGPGVPATPVSPFSPDTSVVSSTKVKVIP